MGLQENLKAAEGAVTYVKSLGIRAINKSSDRVAASGGIEKVVGTEQGDRAIKALEKTGGSAAAAYGSLLDPFDRARHGGTGTDGIRTNVQRYISNKAGNCQEQAEIALVWLYDHHMPKTFHKMAMMAFSAQDYDHVWIVIDLEKETFDKETPGKPDSHNLRNWGQSAVWCDPWQGDGIAFPLQDLVAGRVRNLNAIYKCNTTELVAAGKPKILAWVEKTT